MDLDIQQSITDSMMTQLRIVLRGLMELGSRWSVVAVVLALSSALAQSQPTPKLPTLTVVASRTTEYFRHSEGSAIELRDGRLLLAWSRFRGTQGDDNSRATLVLAESKGAGQPWSAPRELPVGEASINIMQASFLPVTERLVLAFTVRGTNGGKYAIESTDHGQTWGKRRFLFSAGGPNDRAVRLKSGRILLPAHRTAATRVGGSEDMEILVARSDDEGKSWHLSEPIGHDPHPMELKKDNPRPLKLHEPSVAELDNGTLLMLARSSAGRLYRSFSKDGGATWERLTPTQIPSFVAPPYLRKLRDGRIALLWNPIVGEEALQRANKHHMLKIPLGFDKRVRLAMMLTRDGHQWTAERVLAEDTIHGFCYPAMLELRSGQLLLFCSRTTQIISPCDLVQIGPFDP